MKFSYSLIKKFVPRLPAKQKLAEAINLHSFEVESVKADILDINLPPNRYSDCASHIGIAREAAAIFSLTLKNPVMRIVNPPTNQGRFSVEVKNKKLCPRYVARLFEVKKIGFSPAWLIKILKDCGLKPINYIVDLMNYVMLETGQPLHAFDFEKLRGKKIVVRPAKKSEKIETLDGQRFMFDKDVLVIADADRPHAIAGVKGGAASGVSAKTKSIIVESANFDAVSIYKTSRRLKLQTDASLRFSHAISPELAGIGIDRATELLRKAGAKLVDSVDVYPRPVKDEIIEFNPQEYEVLVGAKVSEAKAKNHFRRLGFAIEKTRFAEAEARRGKKLVTGNFLVRIPAWRTDIENFEDLAEEIARLSGYNKLKSQPPTVSLRPAREDDTPTFKDKARRVLLGLQLDEIYNYSFVSEGDVKERNLFGWQPVQLENSISKEFEYLRASLEPGIFKNLKDNSRFYERVGVFEIGKVFGLARRSRGGGGPISERLFLGIGMAAKKDEKVVLELKGAFDEFLKGVGLADYFFNEVQGVLRIESGRDILGFIIPVEESIGKQWHAAFGELDMEKLLALAEEEKEFEPLTKYPTVMRDISILVDRSVRIGEILEAIEDASPKLTENVDLVDEYVDEGFHGKQSLTFRIVFQAEDRTLTDTEVERELEKVVSGLRKNFKAEVR